MRSINSRIRRYWLEEDGIVFGEYALLLSILTLLAAVGLAVLVGAIDGKFTGAANNLDNPAP